MYLLYLDESGKPRGSYEDYFVFGGVALHEEDCYPFAQSLTSLQARHLSGADALLELHASRIWSGRIEWAHVPEKTRRSLITAVFAHLGSWKAPSRRAPIYFAVAVHKKSFKGRNIHELATEEILARFDSLLDRLHLSGDSHRSLVIADESSYEAVVQNLVPKWKVSGSRIGKLHSVIEVPLFVDSKASRVVQAADFVAWAVWQYYENNHTQHIQMLNQRFDSATGLQHGMVHLVTGYKTCACIACSSRRTSSIGMRIPRL